MVTLSFIGDVCLAFTILYSSCSFVRSFMFSSAKTVSQYVYSSVHVDNMILCVASVSLRGSIHPHRDLLLRFQQTSFCTVVALFFFFLISDCALALHVPAMVRLESLLVPPQWRKRKLPPVLCSPNAAGELDGPTLRIDCKCTCHRLP